MSKLIKNIFPAPIWSIIWTLDQDHYRNVMVEEVLPCLKIRLRCYNCPNSVSYGDPLFKAFVCEHCGVHTCVNHDQADEKSCHTCKWECTECGVLTLAEECAPAAPVILLVALIAQRPSRVTAWTVVTKSAAIATLPWSNATVKTNIVHYTCTIVSGAHVQCVIHNTPGADGAATIAVYTSAKSARSLTTECPNERCGSDYACCSGCKDPFPCLECGHRHCPRCPDCVSPEVTNYDDDTVDHEDDDMTDDDGTDDDDEHKEEVIRVPMVVVEEEEEKKASVADVVGTRQHAVVGPATICLDNGDVYVLDAENNVVVLVTNVVTLVNAFMS